MRTLRLCWLCAARSSWPQGKIFQQDHQEVSCFLWLLTLLRPWKVLSTDLILMLGSIIIKSISMVECSQALLLTLEPSTSSSQVVHVSLVMRQLLKGTNITLISVTMMFVTSFYFDRSRSALGAAVFSIGVIVSPIDAVFLEVLIINLNIVRRAE